MRGRLLRYRTRHALSTRCVGLSVLVYLLVETGMMMLARLDVGQTISNIQKELKSHLKRNNLYNSSAFQADLVREARELANCQEPDTSAGYVICDRLPFTRITCGEMATDGWELPVPNMVHLVWLGDPFKMSYFHQYLTIRSVASLQRPTAIYFHHGNGNDIEMTELWRRVLDEIPCVRVLQADPPSSAFGQILKNPTAQSDFYRLLVLQKYGGIYLDLDVITLKPFDWLRSFPLTLGRSLLNKISNGIILAQPGAHFIQRWIDSYITLDSIKNKPFSYWGLVVPYQLYETSQGDDSEVHLELTSMNRPNPFQDGLNSTTSENYDLDGNYFLHVHPQVFPLTSNEHLFAARERHVRTMDNTYGAAARVALFGSSDLVFLPGETPFAKMPTKKLEDNAPFSGDGTPGEGLLERLSAIFQTTD